MNGIDFAEYLLFELLPHMNPFPQQNSILVLDNASIHRNQILMDYIQQLGIVVIYLPPYSPRYNPIELVFNSIKGYMQSYPHYSKSYPIRAVLQALQVGIGADFSSVFTEAGFSVDG